MFLSVIYTRGFFVGAFDHTLSQLKTEIPEIGGSEDTYWITKKSCINVLNPTKKN